MMRFVAQMPSPTTGVGLQQMHGVASRVDPSATAFAHRAEQFDFLILSQWSDSTDSARNTQWTRAFFAAMQPHLDDTVYVNNLGDEGQDRVHAAYGPNYNKLAALKAKYDPANLFRTTKTSSRRLRDRRSSAQGGAPICASNDRRSRPATSAARQRTRQRCRTRRWPNAHAEMHQVDVDDQLATLADGLVADGNDTVVDRQNFRRVGHRAPGRRAPDLSTVFDPPATGSSSSTRSLTPATGSIGLYPLPWGRRSLACRVRTAGSLRQRGPSDTDSGALGLEPRLRRHGGILPAPHDSEAEPMFRRQAHGLPFAGCGGWSATSSRHRSWGRVLSPTTHLGGSSDGADPAHGDTAEHRTGNLAEFKEVARVPLNSPRAKRPRSNTTGSSATMRRSASYGRRTRTPTPSWRTWRTWGTCREGRRTRRRTRDRGLRRSVARIARSGRCLRAHRLPVLPGQVTVTSPICPAVHGERHRPSSRAKP